MTSRTWYIQATCATTGDGLYEGLDWLSNILKSKIVSPSRFPIKKFTTSTVPIDKRIIIVGLENSGQSHILHDLKLGTIVTSNTSIAFKTVNFQERQIRLLGIERRYKVLVLAAGS